MTDFPRVTQDFISNSNKYFSQLKSYNYISFTPPSEAKLLFEEQKSDAHQRN
jgi:hypothetical protein